MPGVPPDAMSTMKKAFKGMFGKKKPHTDEDTPTATTHAPSSSTTKPTETTPAAPVPAAVAEPAMSEHTPATSSTAPEAVAAAEPRTDKAADLTESRSASQTPEPVDAVAPTPPTAVSAQTPTSEAREDAEVKPMEFINITEQPPAPTPGMSATSGPMGTPDFAADSNAAAPTATHTATPGAQSGQWEK